MATLRVTSLRGRTGNASPTLPDGAVVTGVVTATSFSGDGSSLTGIAATDNVSTSTLNVVGFSTLAGATFSGIATFADGVTVTGTITADEYDGYTLLDNSLF